MQAVSSSQRREGDDFKKISAWAAVLFAPTLVGTIHGMSFETMPELHWAGGYPFAVLLMAVVCVSLYVILKKRDRLQPGTLSDPWPACPCDAHR